MYFKKHFINYKSEKFCFLFQSFIPASEYCTSLVTKFWKTDLDHFVWYSDTFSVILLGAFEYGNHLMVGQFEQRNNKSDIQTCSDLKCTLQWWSDSKLVWYLNGRKDIGYQMVRYSNAIWIWDKWTPSCFLMYWSGIWMVVQVHRSLY